MTELKTKRKKKRRRAKRRLDTTLDHKPLKLFIPPRLLLAKGSTRPVAASDTQRMKRRELRQAMMGKKGTYEIRAVTTAAGDREGEILLYGPVGQDFWGDGNSAADFAERVSGLGDVGTIRLRINSGGGDVFDGTAIYNTLVKTDARVIVDIEGVAASAATLIAMAGDEIRMAENAYFMIHRASGAVWGNAVDIRAYLELLDMADDLLILTYEARTGISKDDLVGMMDRDNWMTAAEALDLGFIDAVDEAKKVDPDITPETVAKAYAKLDATNVDRARDVLHTLSAMVAAPLRAVDPPHLQKEVQAMNPDLKAKCIAAGMDANLTDADAQVWILQNADKLATASSTPAPAAGLNEDRLMAILDRRDANVKARREQHRKQVTEMFELAFDAVDNAPSGVFAECLELDDLDAVRARIQDAKAKATASIAGSRIAPSRVQPRDNHIAALRSALQVKALGAASRDVSKHAPEAQRAAGWEDFRHARLVDICRECLMADGYSYEQLRPLSSQQIAQAALGFRSHTGLRADAGLHVTSTLSYITQDAVNKSLLAGYDEAPQTWRGPGRQAESVPDFKTIHRIKLGAAPNLSIWPDNTEPNNARLSNAEETYAVEARAEELSFSWRMVINDDMSALSRLPAMMGDAAARTVNAVFWSVVTANPTMSDGQALFSAATGNRKRANLTTGSATPTTTTLGAMRKLMRLMRGLNTPEENESEDTWNLTPRYLVGPAALEQLILVLVNSSAEPAATFSSGVYNTARTLEPVIEPLLDANSATAWYLFADPARIDTIEVTFLQGHETPVTYQYMDDKTMSQNFIIIQTYAAKAIDHRGVQKHAGA